MVDAARPNSIGPAVLNLTFLKRLPTIS